MTRAEEIAGWFKSFIESGAPYVTDYRRQVPEIVKNSAIASDGQVNCSLADIRSDSLSPMDIGRLYDTLYTEDATEAFINAYIDNAPDLYTGDDGDTGAPWCAPWSYGMMSCKCAEEDTPESLGAAYAAHDYDDLKAALEEDERFKAEQERIKAEEEAEFDSDDEEPEERR